MRRLRGDHARSGDDCRLMVVPGSSPGNRDMVPDVAGPMVMAQAGPLANGPAPRRDETPPVRGPALASGRGTRFAKADHQVPE
jgi:hypothetical protein